MKIMTHWVYDPIEQCHTKAFFSSKTERATAETKAKSAGKQVVASFEWPVEPTAKGIVDFCRDQLTLREFDNEEAPEDDETEDLDDLL